MGVKDALAEKTGTKGEVKLSQIHEYCGYDQGYEA